jgi:SMODS and SLOG-associating 2TM effector domain family 5
MLQVEWESHDRKLTRITALTSAYVIALTILPYFIKLPQDVTDKFNLFTVALSIVILVSSLLQYSKNEIVNAEQHHRSALEINEIYRDLLIIAERATEAELVEFSRRYNAILQKFSINHADIDYLRYQIERPEEYTWITRTQKIRIHLRLFFSQYLPTFVLLLITFLVALLIFGYAFPHRLT